MDGNEQRPLHRRRVALAGAVGAVLLLPGCAILPIAAIGGLLVEAGGGALVKTGTEYTASGIAVRTVAIPVCDVRAAVLTTFRRTEITIVEDEVSKNGRLTITGEATHRTVHVRLTPLTPALTQIELHVKRNVLASDKATASELLAETERALAENRAFAARLEDVSTRSSSQ